MSASLKILIFLLLAGLIVLGYSNFRQQEVIDAMNDVLLKQAQHSHELQLKKHELERKLEQCRSRTDTVSTD